MTTANGARRPRYIRTTAAAISSDGCGHGAGCTDLSARSYGRDEGRGGADRRKIVHESAQLRPLATPNHQTSINQQGPDGGETPPTSGHDTGNRYPAGRTRGQDQGMQVSVLYFADCPNWRDAGQRLRRALDQIGRPDTEIGFVEVHTEAEAAALGFAGSPTFTLDGVDLFGPAPTSGGLTCRVYATPGGLAGVPEVADLVAALTEKARS
jgi:hypothetical protein